MDRAVVVDGTIRDPVMSRYILRLSPLLVGAPLLVNVARTFSDAMLSSDRDDRVVDPEWLRCRRGELEKRGVIIAMPTTTSLFFVLSLFVVGMK